jgi:hypothetical protein
VVLTILAIGGAVLFSGVAASLVAADRARAQVAKGDDTLSAAKLALLAYVLRPPNTAQILRPGTLPTPDSLANGAYDGLEDNACLSNATNGLPAATAAASTTKRCLGRIPWRALGLEVGDVNANDPGGVVPWLAVSANLVFYDNCLFVLNTDVATLASPGTPSCPTSTLPVSADPQPTTLPHPWLTVRDHYGNVISNTVAAVLIRPGEPIATETTLQNRNPTNPPWNPSDYLDTINLPLGCSTGCTLRGNSLLDNEFLLIPPGTRYPADAENMAKRGTPVPFNDQLVYITAEEIMRYAAKRVASEVAAAMNTFQAGKIPSSPTLTGFSKYPWLQPLNTSYSDSLSLTSVDQTILGAVPFLMEVPGTGELLPKYRTGFDWVLSGVVEEAVPVNGCVQVRSTPTSRYIKNPLSASLTATNALGYGPFVSGSATTADGTCAWKGENKISCEKSLGNGATITRTVWSTLTRCQNNSVITAGTLTYSISSLKLIFSSDNCGSTATFTDALTATNHVHQWNLSCPSSTVEPRLAFEALLSTASAGYNQLPKTARVQSSTSSGHSISVSKMHFAPILPKWFFHNRWYTTTFAMYAPGSPRLAGTLASNPCGTRNYLTRGSLNSDGTISGAAESNGMVIMTGAALTGQTHPSSVISNYLDANNSTGGTTCNWVDAAFAGSRQYNDLFQPLTP